MDNRIYTSVKDISPAVGLQLFIIDLLSAELKVAAFVRNSARHYQTLIMRNRLYWKVISGYIWGDQSRARCIGIGRNDGGMK